MISAKYANCNCVRNLKLANMRESSCTHVPVSTAIAVGLMYDTIQYNTNCNDTP